MLYSPMSDGLNIHFLLNLCYLRRWYRFEFTFPGIHLLLMQSRAVGISVIDCPIFLVSIIIPEINNVKSCLACIALAIALSLLYYLLCHTYVIIYISDEMWQSVRHVAWQCKVWITYLSEAHFSLGFLHLYLLA